MYFNNSVKYHLALLIAITILWSFENCKNFKCHNKIEIALNCGRRNWQLKATAPIGSQFSEVDSISYFWPIDAESRNRVFKTRDNNTYVIFKYCDYHYEGKNTLRFYGDMFAKKMKDSGASQINMNFSSNYFICEYLFYSANFHKDVYLIVKTFKREEEIITIFGLNLGHNSSFTNKNLYNIIKRTELVP